MRRNPPRPITTFLRYLLAFAAVGAAALLTAARLLTPLIADHPERIEAAVSAHLGRPVTVGQVQATWSGLTPRVELRDLRLAEGKGSARDLHIARAYIEIDAVASLMTWQLRPKNLVLVGLSITLRRLPDGRMMLGDAQSTGNRSVSPAQKIVMQLTERGRLGLDAATVEWCDTEDSACQVFRDVYLRIDNQGNRHQLQVTARLPSSLGESLQLAAHITGDLLTPAGWQASIYLRGERLRLAEWLQGERAHLPQPVRQWQLAAGVVDTELWGAWAGGGLQHLTGTLAAYDLRGSLRDTPEVSIQRLGGNLDWRRREDGWSLIVQRFALSRQMSNWPATRLAIASDPDYLSVSSTFVRLGDVVELLEPSGLLPEAAEDLLRSLRPAADVYDLKLRLPRSGLAGMFAEGRFVDLTTRNWRALPGVVGLDGHLRMSSDWGEMVLASHTVTVDPGPYLRTQIALETLRGTIRWQQDDGDWSVVSDNLAWRNSDLKATARLWVGARQDQASPFLSLVVSVEDGDLGRVRDYLPATHLPPRAQHWLDQAFVSGRIAEGTVLIHGPLHGFPYHQGDGRFEADFRVTDAVLSYHPDWPPIEDLAARVRLVGTRLEVTSDSCRLGGGTIHDARVDIDDLGGHPAVVLVQGRATGPADGALRFLFDTPLRPRFAPYLEGAEAKGDVDLALDLKIPLSPEPTTVTGRLTLANNDVLFAKQDLPLRQVTGELDFTERTVKAEALSATLWGNSMTLSIRSRKVGKDAETEIAARGNITMDSLAKELGLDDPNFISGQTEWRGKLAFPAASSDPPRLEVVSALRGVHVDLPVPLGKQAGDSIALRAAIEFQHGKEAVSLGYGTRATAAFLVRSGSAGRFVDKAEVRLGDGVAEMPQDDSLRLVGESPSVELSGWLDLLSTPDHAMRSLVGANRSTYVDIRVGEATLVQPLHAIHLTVRNTDEGWAGQVSAEELAGSFQTSNRHDPPTLTLALERLRLEPSAWERAGDTLRAPMLSSLHIASEHLYYGSADVGSLSLSAFRDDSDLRVDDLKVTGPLLALNAKGKSLMRSDSPRSEMDVTLKADDLGRLMELFNYAPAIKNGKTDAELKAHWPGTFTDFSVTRVDGSMTLSVEDGRLIAVEPGVGRIFGLLSLQALPRRLALNFSDVLDKGFAFDQITGTFQIRDGQAYTRNLRLDGPVARIQITGRTGLASQDYDQHATVTPKVTGGLPWAAALSGGPAVGAALFLVQTLLDNPLDRIMSYQYRVTGSWQHPLVQQVEGRSASP